MAYRRRGKRPRRAAATLESLEALAGELQELQARLIGTERELKSLLSERNRRSEERKKLAGRIVELRTQGKVSIFPGIGKRLTPTARAWIKELEIEIAALSEESEWGGGGKSLAHLIRSLEYDHSRLKHEEHWLGVRMERSRRAEVAAQNKLEKAARAKANRAIVARAKGEVRTDASRLKKSLPRDHACPYCGGNLGVTPHPDHIHPVSKGGLSIKTNLVYVCSPCNTKKKNLTLNQFIDLAKLDYKLVRSRLQMLGKDC